MAGATILLSACAGHSDLPTGAAAFPAAASPAPRLAKADLDEYRIGPRDILMVTVFNEPGLTFPQMPVSSGGTIALPLIGSIDAVGQTSAQLADDISRRLNARYLRNARTAVAVVTPTNYTVTVDGSVNKPGIYDIPGQLMLSQSLALAGGGTQFAKMSEVVVVRDIEGQRYAARFDMNDIRAGRAPDFRLKQSDTVIVGFDRVASIFRNIIGTLPVAAAVFVAVRR